MEKQHLTYFKIENFKRFDSFEMSNLGQFNLIVGDNNVGKTSVLEALTFDEDATRFTANYLETFLNRGHRISTFGRIGHLNIKKIPSTDFWQTIFKDPKKPIIFHTAPSQAYISVNLLSSGSLNKEEADEIRKTVVGVVPEYWIKIVFNDSGFFQITPAYFENKEMYQSDPAFIAANLSYDDDLVTYFYRFFNEHKSTRRELEQSLKLIIPNLEELRIHRFYGERDMIAFSIKDNDNLQPVTQYGDGTVKVLRLLMEIIAHQNLRLMVDEIGSGIHFTRLKEYWKTIIQLCFKYNVQLFATTHSLECQQAFIEALEDEEMKQYQKDARNISLIENKQGEVKAVTYDFGQFEYALNIGFNTRGGAR
ncbi:AAA family ATPase [Spirosoma foliorum]|uniref:AAA family ATPase n=1 Tax=Spirosoma foliorum TaxID=2710596 RepID=A0A7G5GMS9_9BACT|nr:AAA family ATPase [Spirosoma foliorum]QMW00171.1 AAA family ATPase [Spirosoma foliorum]